MKQRFNKLLATLLAATLCVPALPAVPARAAEPKAADDASIVWTEPESTSTTQLDENERFINFNEEWKFYLGDYSTAYKPNFIDSSWEEINLPHDFSITQDFTPDGEAESGFLPGGIGWYRKKFSLSENFADKSVVLNFDGVYKDATVYVNGTKLGENHYGYTPFAFDISNYLTCDNVTENVIAVRVEHKTPSSRWYSGSGIYRDVTLIVSDPVHVDMNGTLVTTPNLASSNGSDGATNIAVDIKNDSDTDASVTVKNTIYEKGGETPVASASDTTADVKAGATKTVTVTASFSNPKLWSIETPNLYTVRTEIVQNGQTVDTYETDFGYKWYKFVNDTGFQLNGENVKINGVCMHHDQGALGAAAYYDAIYRQMSIMKDMGVNTIRITHNPGAEILVDICNELGLLVIEEYFDGWAWYKNGNTNDFSVYFSENLTEDNQLIGGNPSITWAEFVLKSIVKRDRNDASMILWSLGNEIDESSPSTPGMGQGPLTWKDIAENLISWTKAVDSQHPVTSGSNRRSLSGDNDTGVTSVNQTVFTQGGVPGYNYGDINSMTNLHTRYPVMLWSETASAVNSRGIYNSQSSQTNADGKYHLTSYDKSCVGWGKTAHASMYPTLSNDWIAGECVWTGFDYIGEPTPWNGTTAGDGGRGAIPNSSYFGIVETSGFPKDNFYLYRSQWNQNANTLHLVTAWDSNNQMLDSDGKTPVWIYSNAPKVELYLNNQKIGTATRKALSQTTTAAGHVHYEYTTESNDQNVCATNSGSGDESLYSVFNVKFTAGTISAKAFDENGAEITSSCAGKNSVSTPDSASKLVIPDDYPNQIDADGKSLAYITVDVTDANGNLNTKADNMINFSLTGNGEIVGVDNGDQATTEKFQQSSVLQDKKTANIHAYAGKALVIVRSSKNSGGFTLNASSDGLEGASAAIQTTGDGSSSDISIKQYKLSKHCYLPIGSTMSDITLPQTATAIFTDETEQSLSISWSDFDASKLKEKGNYRVDGFITYNGKKTDISILLHAYAPILGVQNVSLCTAQNVFPTLSNVSMSYDIDGEPFEEYPVTWKLDGITADSFANIDDVIAIEGTVSIFGKEYATTASVRVAESNVIYTNAAIGRAHLTDNGKQNGSKTNNDGTKSYEDSLSSVTDGNRQDNGGSSDRWSDWSNKNKEERQDNLQIAMDWDTATETDLINIFYNTKLTNGGQISFHLPDLVKFEYATASNINDFNMIDATTWIPIEYEDPIDILNSDGSTSFGSYTIGKSYKLRQKVNPQAIRITFGHPGNQAIGINEIEIMSPTYTYDLNTSASLSGVKIGTKTVAFEEGKTEYIVDASTIEANDITFENADNASVTVLPLSKRVVKIISVSEDGEQTKIYTLKSQDEPKEETKTSVNQALEDFQKLPSSSYTSGSYNALKALADEIKQNIDNYSESELQAKLKELNAKKNDLATAATYNSLQGKLNTYGKLNKANYSTASWNTLNSLMLKIKTNLNTYSESQLKAQIQALDAAYKALAPAEKNPPKEEPKVDSVTSKNVQYKILDEKKNTATALKLDNAKATNVTIQATVKIDGVTYKVVQISPNAFSKASKLKSVTIGKNVKTIGKNAFNQCKKLNKVIFKGSSAPKISSGAFKKTASKITVKVPKKLKKASFKKTLTKAGMSKKLTLK